jgi:hypothetical protein
MTGKTISHYRILVKLGGGMSLEYKSAETKLCRLVALLREAGGLRSANNSSGLFLGPNSR